MSAHSLSARPGAAYEATSHRSDRYRDEYVAAFVAKWDELVDWDRRAAAEGSFFVDVLTAHGVRTVLDVATGTGFHSVSFKNSGFDVTSVDGCACMLERARLNGLRRGAPLATVHSDWRWLARDVAGPFDAIVCLGNSFTHLFEEDDRRAALAQYHDLLAPGGVLLIDQRNYDALLDRGAAPRRRYYYCGTTVSARPISVDDGVARFRYEFADGSAFYLDMFPLRRHYLIGLIGDAGFDAVTTYGDFQSSFDETEPDFFVHVARKKSEAHA
jgi:SAM-dependent methyltransferase